MKQYKPFLVWVLIVGGLLWGYQGVTGNNLLATIIGAQIASTIEIIVGVVALVMAYIKITHKGK